MNAKKRKNLYIQMNIDDGKKILIRKRICRFNLESKGLNSIPLDTWSFFGSNLNNVTKIIQTNKNRKKIHQVMMVVVVEKFNKFFHSFLLLNKKKIQIYLIEIREKLKKKKIMMNDQIWLIEEKKFLISFIKLMMMMMKWIEGSSDQKKK